MLAFAVLLYACVLFAQANEASLNQQYRSKILTLRHPFRSNSQNYEDLATQSTRAKKDRGRSMAAFK